VILPGSRSHSSWQHRLQLDRNGSRKTKLTTVRVTAQHQIEIRLGDRNFRARSIDRDANTDRSRVNSILEVIENALSAAEQERSCLNRRVEDALTRTAVTIGNGTDEYLERDALDSHHQDLFSRNFQRSTSPQRTHYGDHTFQISDGRGVE
jgi:hypothetical protein